MSLPARIALVGFMGSGKSTVGRILADRMDYRFVDSDETIEAQAGAKVSEIFELRGEAVFRQLERETILDLLRNERTVIATGGGTFAQPECAEELLARTFVVHLSCDFAAAFARVREMGGRPLLLKGETEARGLFAERKDKYARSHAVVDTTHRSPHEAAMEVFRILPHS